jgi:hypothetical protein
VVLARGEFSRDEFSTSDNDHGIFGQLFDGTLIRSRARCLSLCA